MGLPVTIGLVTVAVGETYQRFLPQWAEAVANLQRKPDQITIVVDYISEYYVQMLDEILESWQLLTSNKTWKHHPQILANEAISVTHTDWICKLDADDLILPHAFNQLDQSEADIYTFGLAINGQRIIIPAPITANQLLACNFNPITAASPFRKKLWENSTGFHDIIYDDWLFWRETAEQNPTYQSSISVDYLYRLDDYNASKNCDDAEERKKVFQ
jgi:hypothetical protein